MVVEILEFSREIPSKLFEDPRNPSELQRRVKFCSKENDHFNRKIKPRFQEISILLSQEVYLLD